MRVLLLGSGGREHALAWKLAQSPLLKQLYAAPGNPGMALHATCVDLPLDKPEAVANFARDRRIDLVVVGPEAPLVAGVADALAAEGIACFGPVAAAARLEGSKAFAKEIMLAANVPTARSETFDDVQAAMHRAQNWGAVVVKADGLAGGKGVVVADNGDEAAEAVRTLSELPGGKRLVLEERLSGPELSIIALCDGQRYVLLPVSQDHKRVGENDTGPNTGGMGAYAPAKLMSDEALAALGRAVIAPTLAELAKRGTPFRGALYAGVMLTADGPRVLEYNVRLGDPEAQPLLMLLGEDLLPLLLQCAQGKLDRDSVVLKPGAAVSVVLAAEGYPAAPRTGDAIELDDEALPAGVQIFHASTKWKNGDLVTSGGRVLTVCALAENVDRARSLAYRAADHVTFQGRHLRRDIGAKAT